MKLKDFKASGKRKNRCLVLEIADKSGARDYELRVAGPPALVKRVFAKTEFSIDIDPHRDAEDAAAELQRRAEEPREHFKRLARLEDISALGAFKQPWRGPTPEKTVFVSLQRVRGEGTAWAFGFPYFLPAGSTIVFMPPPVLSLVATVAPVIGDQDLFLNSVFGPLLAFSRFGGITPDTVVFPSPVPTPLPGLLNVTILGFTTGFGNFAMFGVS